MKKKFLITVFSAFVFITTHAQFYDTLVMDESKFLNQVFNYAPTLENAAFKVAIQQQEIRSAKGVFEPKLIGRYRLKDYENQSYFNKQQTGINIATPLGVKFEVGFQDNQGLFLNPENTVPSAGLVYTGIELPLGARMFTDEDRTYIKQQRLKNDVATSAQNLTINDYLLDAGEQYWDLFESIKLMDVSKEALTIARQRFDFIVSQNRLGYAASIDTLEAKINVQYRLALNTSNFIRYQKMSFAINNFLWLPNRDQLFIVPNVDMDYMAVFPDSLLKKELVKTHPLVLILDTDSMINQTNLALNREFYKPELDLSLRLQENAKYLEEYDFDINTNNYVGLNLKMPLLLRKQRAKSNQFEFEKSIISNKKRETLVKIENAQRTLYLNTENLRTNVIIWQKAVQNYRTLVRAEQTKFEKGESSLFLVNNRELRWIDAREKYIKNYVKYRKSILNYYHTLAMLPQLLD